eukprot:g5368.t1
MWTALRFAVENGWGGGDSAAKLECLQRELVARFQRARSAVDPYDLEQYLTAFLEEQFEVDCDDGSGREVANALVAMHAQCATGDTSMAARIIQQSQTATTATMQEAEAPVDGMLGGAGASACAGAVAGAGAGAGASATAGAAAAAAPLVAVPVAPTAAAAEAAAAQQALGLLAPAPGTAAVAGAATYDADTAMEAEYECERDCGFSGSFEAVTAHESVCTHGPPPQ